MKTELTFEMIVLVDSVLLSDGRRIIAQFAFKTEERMAEIAQDFAGELLAYAVENAPWEDQTGDARAGLSSEAYADNNHIGVDLFHTVEYGIFLELRWGAKYAIILPTVEKMGSKLLNMMEGICSEIIYYD
jgi:hypothetical protein